MEGSYFFVAKILCWENILLYIEENSIKSLQEFRCTAFVKNVLESKGIDFGLCFLDQKLAFVDNKILWSSAE